MTTSFIPSSSTTQQLVQFCRKAAPLSSLALYVSPLSTILQVTQDKTVGTLPLLPYTSMLSNNVVWAVYGLLKKEPIIIFANGIGLLLSLGYFVQYIRVGPTSLATTLPGSIRQHIGFVSVISLLVLLVALSVSVLGPTQPTEILGKSGMILTMAMFASPLAALKTVVQTQSAQSIPFPVTIASLANNYLWGIVGFLDMKDSNVYLPAIVGLTFSFIQLGLKVWYRETPKIPIAKKGSKIA
jgi:solute carrier family 50 (sugar transporter)